MSLNKRSGSEMVKGTDHSEVRNCTNHIISVSEVVCELAVYVSLGSKEEGMGWKGQQIIYGEAYEEILI